MCLALTSKPLPNAFESQEDQVPVYFGTVGTEIDGDSLVTRCFIVAVTQREMTSSLSTITMQGCWDSLALIPRPAWQC